MHSGPKSADHALVKTLEDRETERLSEQLHFALLTHAWSIKSNNHMLLNNNKLLDYFDKQIQELFESYCALNKSGEMNIKTVVENEYWRQKIDIILDDMLIYEDNSHKSENDNKEEDVKNKDNVNKPRWRIESNAQLNGNHPGLLLNNLTKDIPVQDLALTLGVTRQNLYRLFNGKIGITTRLALRLEENGIGPSALEWLAYQNDFDLNSLKDSLSESADLEVQSAPRRPRRARNAPRSIKLAS